MRLIVGLGNSGKKYKRTRHNVGFAVLDKLQTEISKSKYRISKQIPNSNFQTKKKFHCLLFTVDQSLILAKPMTFMNDSGVAVSSLAIHFKLSAADIHIIHDDLDIKLGEYKIQKGKGPRDHKGLLSIYERLGTKDFWHVRVGVENRGKSQIANYGLRIPGKDYVLQKFTDDELSIIKRVISEVADDLMNNALS